MADDSNLDGIYFTQHSFESSHRPGGRRCNRWYLIDQHGDKHLAVTGIAERDSKGLPRSHYNYSAEEPFASIKGLHCSNQLGVYKWLESMIRHHPGDTDHATQSRAAATPTASMKTSEQHTGKRKVLPSAPSRPTSAKQPRRMFELNNLHASNAVLPGISAAAPGNVDNSDDDNDQSKGEEGDEGAEGGSQDGKQQAGDAGQGGDRKGDAAKINSVATGRQPAAAAAAAGGAATATAAAAPEQEQRTHRTRSAAAGARVPGNLQPPPKPKPASAVPDLAMLAQQLQKGIARESAARTKLEQDHKKLQQQHRLVQQEHQQLKQIYTSLLMRNGKLEEKVAYLQQQLETEAAGALSGLQTGPGSQELMQQLLAEAKAQRDAERTRSAAQVEAERNRSATQLDAERARHEGQLQAEREKVTELNRTVAVLEYAAGVDKKQLTAVQQQLETAQQEVQQLQKHLVESSRLMSSVPGF